MKNKASNIIRLSDKDLVKFLQNKQTINYSNKSVQKEAEKNRKLNMPVEE